MKIADALIKQVDHTISLRKAMMFINIDISLLNVCIHEEHVFVMVIINAVIVNFSFTSYCPND